MSAQLINILLRKLSGWPDIKSNTRQQITLSGQLIVRQSSIRNAIPASKEEKFC
jgi:hypothetical protein